jgi:drug/metabolite transporter (DMT)-like permease
VLGAILAVLSAATFALNNAAARRAVVTGTPTQGMVVTIPIGVLCFLPLAIITGGIAGLGQFSAGTIAWLAGVGLLHFLVGRYCNYRANQAAGVNLTAPVIQLQVVVTLVLAVAVLHEPCTALQIVGGLLMLAGSFITQRLPRAAPAYSAGRPSGNLGAAAAPTFVPRHSAGYLFASIAALAYGTTPVMVRTALEHAGPLSGILGALIAYSSATVAIAVALLSPPLRRDVMALQRENVRWFAYSGVFVAAAQGFFYSAIAIAPIMVVMPLMQLALVFRFAFAVWLNPHHEVFGPAVIIGSAVSILGACAVSIDTGVILDALAVPEAFARLLLWRV